MKSRIMILFEGLLAALLVFLLGFGMMYLFWNTIEYPASAKGLFYYRAATWGDGLCLPVMTFCLVCFIQKNSKWRKSTLIQKVLVLLSFIIAICEQARWLLSNKTDLNWTIPVQHYFNIAGWWHSLFFIIMVGGTVSLIINFFNPIRYKTENHDNFDFCLFFGFVLSSTTFVMIHFVDDYGNKFSLTNILSSIMIIMYAIYIPFLSWKKKHTNSEVRSQLIIPTLFALICAYGISIMICNLEIGHDWLMSLGTAIACSLVWKEKKSILQVLAISVICLIGFFPIFNYVCQTETLIEKIIVLTIVLPILIMIEKKSYHNFKWHTSPVIVSVLYIVIKSLPLNYQKTILEIFGGTINISGFTDILFLGIIYFLFFKETQNLFDNVIQLEQKRNNGQLHIIDFYYLKKLEYIRIIILLFGIVCLIGQWIKDIAETRNITFFFMRQDMKINYLYIIAIILTVSFLIFLTLISKKTKINRLLLGIIVILIPILLSLNSHECLIVTKYNLYELSIESKLLMGISAFSIVGVPLLIATGFQTNTANLQGRRGDFILKMFSLIMFVNVLTISLINTYILITKTTIATIFITFFNLIIVCVLIPTCCAICLQNNNYKRSKVIPGRSFDGVLQDGFSSIIAHSFLVGLPCIYIKIMGKPDLQVWGSLSVAMALAINVVGFFLQNNIKHISQQKKVLTECPDDVELWFELYERLKLQSIITVITTLPYCISGIILEFLIYVIDLRDDTDNEGFFKYIIKKYIDSQRYEDDIKQLRHRRNRLTNKKSKEI